MSRLPAAVFLAAVTGAAAWQVLMMIPAHKNAQASEKVKPAPLEVKEIELSTVYSTSRQEKLKYVREPLAEDSPGEKALDSLRESLSAAKSGPVIGIVRGENIEEAVVASDRFVGMKKPPRSAVGPDEKSTSKKHWLVIYLGQTHSSPPHWVVHPVQISARRIRFSYSVYDDWPNDTGGGIASADVYPYLYWVLLGDLTDPSETDAELVFIEKSVKATFPTKK